MNQARKKGFTLVELVIVIAVIAVLSAILIPTFGTILKDSKETAAKADLKSAITTYISENADVDGADVDMSNKCFVQSDTTPTAPAANSTVYVYKDGEISEITLTAAATGTAVALAGGWYMFTYTA